MKVVSKYKSLLKLEFFKHAKNYLTADFFNKGLAFITIPFFTRLLSESDYGTLAVFNTVVSLFSIFFFMGTGGALIRYYHEDNKEYSKYVGSNIIYLLILNLIIATIILLLITPIANTFSIGHKIFTLAIIISSLSAFIRLYFNHLQASKTSKQYSILSIIQSLSIVVIAIVLIVTLEKDKYYGKIYAQLGISIILAIYFLILFLRIAKLNFNFSYFKYALKFGAPLVPHMLSGIILASFDKLIINQLNGAVDTGLYSFAYNVGTIMYVVVMAMNRSWVPIFYEYLNKKDYSSINTLLNKYSQIVVFIGIVLILFAKEIVFIMADEKYYDALPIVPIVIVSYFFLFLYTLFSNYAFYRKKTLYISIATITAGITNIFLNYILIPKYGYYIAAYTTLFSFFFLFILHFINVKFIMQEKNTFKLLIILPHIAILLCCLLSFYIIESHIQKYIVSFILKIFIVTMSGVLLNSSNKGFFKK